MPDQAAQAKPSRIIKGAQQEEGATTYRLRPFPRRAGTGTDMVPGNGACAEQLPEWKRVASWGHPQVLRSLRESRFDSRNGQELDFQLSALPRQSDWFSCSGRRNSRGSGNEQNFDARPQESRNDSPSQSIARANERGRRLPGLRPDDRGETGSPEATEGAEHELTEIGDCRSRGVGPSRCRGRWRMGAAAGIAAVAAGSPDGE